MKKPEIKKLHFLLIITSLGIEDMMINFMWQLDWDKSCPSVRMFLEKD